MKSRLFASVVVLLVVLVLAPGCDVQSALGCGSSQGSAVEITSVNVQPPSGTNTFSLTVGYRWQYQGKGSVPNPEPVICYYVDSNGNQTRLQDVDTGQGAAADVLFSGKPGPVEGSSSQTFNVVPPEQYSPAEPGVYTAVCYVQSNPSKKVTWNFNVVAATPESTTTSTPASTSTSAPTTTTEATTTTIPLPVYRLQVEMVCVDPNPTPHEYHGSWSGNLTLNPDGSVRATLPGSLTASIPWENINDKHVGDWRLAYDFTVEVAGSGKATATGVSLRLQQTLGDYTVQPVSVIDGQISAADLATCQKSAEQTAESLLDKILLELQFDGTSLPATEDVSVGIWNGKATLSRVQQK